MDADTSSIEFLSMKDMAKRFQCSRETIRRKVRDGDLPKPDLGDIHSRGIKSWLASNVVTFLANHKADREKLERDLLKRAI